VEARQRLPEAIDEAATSTLGANPARSTEEPDADALANRPPRHVFADGIDATDDLVSRDTGVREAGESPFDREDVRVADAARFDSNPDFIRSGCGKLPFDELHLSAADGLDRTIGSFAHRDTSPNAMFDNRTSTMIGSAIGTLSAPGTRTT
jgi:hypothetical protein